MSAPSETYIDPASGNDGNPGTKASPYKTVQFALDNTTRDATNGDRFNVKAGSTDVLSTKLVLTTYGSPTQAAPILLQGYTTNEGDGGIGDIDGGGSSVFNTSSKNAFHVIDMVMHNCGANQIFRAGADCVISRSEFHKMTSTSVAVQVTTRSQIIDCYIHDFTGAGASVTNGTIAYCFIDKSHTTDTNPAITTSLTGTVHHNILTLSGATNKASGIAQNGSGVFTHNNSIWSNAGDGVGIKVAGNINGGTVYNNLVEGFSGSGGIGIDTITTSRITAFYNSINDCETEFSLSHDEVTPYGNNETLSASPFVDATNNDFTPDDTGGVLTGFIEQFMGPSGTPASFAARGAVEPECAAAAAVGGGRYRGIVPGGGLGAS